MAIMLLSLIYAASGCIVGIYLTVVLLRRRGMTSHGARTVLITYCVATLLLALFGLACFYPSSAAGYILEPALILFPFMFWRALFVWYRLQHPYDAGSGNGDLPNAW